MENITSSRKNLMGNERREKRKKIQTQSHCSTTLPLLRLRPGGFSRSESTESAGQRYYFVWKFQKKNHFFRLKNPFFNIMGIKGLIFNSLGAEEAKDALEG